MRTKVILLIGISMFVIPLLLPEPTFATPWTPMWVRDRNNNFVDDQIERSSSQMEVIIDLNQCVGDVKKSDMAKFISARGDITYIGRYLTFLMAVGIDAKEALEIAGRSEVAMVELAKTGIWKWDNLQATKIRNSGDYPNNLQTNFGWPSTLDGSGVNVALLDTGAGATYDPWFVHGYNALTDTVENPAAEPAGGDHAGYMAEIIFGGTHAVSPGAGLVDMKIGNSSGPNPTAYVRALEEIYDRYQSWGINVVSISGTFNEVADGRETYNQLIDLLSGKGIVVVAAAGGNTSGAAVNTPGAATRAIAVSTSDIQNTVNRGDDTAPYVQGPRANDGDMDQLDELKPEVLFPTGGSYWMTTTSIATAATAGIVALVLNRNSDLADFGNKAGGAVKDLLIRSAENKGTTDTTIAYPKAASTWDNRWGFGEIDAYEAFSNLSDGTQGGHADLTFQSFDGVTPHPNDPWYYSLAVETMSERLGDNIEAGVPDIIYARVYNNGPNSADKVRVSFGFYPFTAGIPKFYDIGSKVVDVPATTPVVVDINWTPPDLGSGEHHGCILVTIDYGYDMDFSNKSNFAQKNVRVHGTSSPAVFTFNVANPFPGKATMILKTINRNKNWEFKLSETSFVLEAEDCARKIKAIAHPGPNAKKGEEAVFFVTLFVRPFGTEEMIEAGGVACKARNEREKALTLKKPVMAPPVKALKKE